MYLYRCILVDTPILRTYVGQLASLLVSMYALFLHAPIRRAWAGGRPTNPPPLLPLRPGPCSVRRRHHWQAKSCLQREAWGLHPPLPAAAPLAGLPACLPGRVCATQPTHTMDSWTCVCACVVVCVLCVTGTCPSVPWPLGPLLPPHSLALPARPPGCLPEVTDHRRVPSPWELGGGVGVRVERRGEGGGSVVREEPEAWPASKPAFPRGRQLATSSYTGVGR